MLLSLNCLILLALISYMTCQVGQWAFPVTAIVSDNWKASPGMLCVIDEMKKKKKWKKIVKATHLIKPTQTTNALTVLTPYFPPARVRWRTQSTSMWHPFLPSLPSLSPHSLSRQRQHRCNQRWHPHCLRLQLCCALMQSSEHGRDIPYMVSSWANVYCVPLLP